MAYIKTTDLEKQVSDYLDQGYMQSYIIDHFTKQKVEERRVRQALDKLVKQIEDEYTKMIDSTLGLHLERYDKEIDQLMEIDFDSGEYDDYPAPALYNLKVQTYLTVQQAMYQKERLLGVHNKKFTLKVIQRNKFIKKPDIISNWNLSTLITEEKMELLELIKKCKKNQNELFGVILKTDKKQEVEITEDVEYTEEKRNVDSIKLIDNKKPEKAKNLDDVKERMKKAFTRKARAAFFEAGGQVDEVGI